MFHTTLLHLIWNIAAPSPIHIQISCSSYPFRKLYNYNCMHLDILLFACFVAKGVDYTVFTKTAAYQQFFFSGKQFHIHKIRLHTLIWVTLVWWWTHRSSYLSISWSQSGHRNWHHGRMKQPAKEYHHTEQRNSTPMKKSTKCHLVTTNVLVHINFY